MIDHNKQNKELKKTIDEFDADAQIELFKYKNVSIDHSKVFPSISAI